MEIAELQVFSDGTGITGEYTRSYFAAEAQTLVGAVRRGGIRRARYRPTRTSPDAFPQLYYRYTGVGGDENR